MKKNNILPPHLMHKLERKIVKRERRSYIYDGKTVASILGGNRALYQRFLRNVERGLSIEESIKLADTKRKTGYKAKLIYKNKPLTQIAKEYKLKYARVRIAFMEGRLDKLI